MGNKFRRPAEPHYEVLEQPPIYEEIDEKILDLKAPHREIKKTIISSRLSQLETKKKVKRPHQH